jgi:hypothetical protein
MSLSACRRSSQGHLVWEGRASGRAFLATKSRWYCKGDHAKGVISFEAEACPKLPARPGSGGVANGRQPVRSVPFSPPLRFRTAGSLQYGFKPVVSGNLRPCGLYAAEQRLSGDMRMELRLQRACKSPHDRAGCIRRKIKGRQNGGCHIRFPNGGCHIRFPLSTLRRRPYDRQRMTRGQRGSLRLRRMKLSFTTSSPASAGARCHLRIPQVRVRAIALAK